MQEKIRINLNNDGNEPNQERIKKDFLNKIKANSDAQNVFQAIANIYKNNQNKLRNSVISCMFSALSRSIDSPKNKQAIKTENLLNLIYDIIKSENGIDTQTYKHMFDSLIKVESLNSDGHLDEKTILFALIQKFWSKDYKVVNNVLLKYVFDELSVLNEKCNNNLKAIDIFNLVYDIHEKNGLTLTEPVILSMFRTLGNAIESRSIENLTTENVFDLIDNILLKSVQVNDAVGDLFGVLDKLNRKKYKSNAKEETKAINIFKSINSWCRNKITNLMGSIILPMFQALESAMMICNVDELDVEKVISLFNDIWNNKENMLANSSNAGDVVRHMFGVLLFAIKRGNTENLKNLRISNLVVLYHGVLKKLKEQNKPIGEYILKPMFTALEYALKKCDHSDIELKQITDLVVANKDQKFRIATIKSIFNVLFAAIKIKNIDDEQIKKMFGAIELNNIGLSLENNEIALTTESKNSKETIIDCRQYINLFNEQLGIIINTEAKKTNNSNINNSKRGNENINQKIENQNKQTDKDKKLDQKLLAQQDIDPVDFLTKNDVDTKQITLQTLNDNFKLDIREQEIKIGFWEWIFTCIKMLVFNFSVFRRKNYHVNQHLLLTKYLGKAKQKAQISNEINSVSLINLFEKLKSKQDIGLSSLKQDIQPYEYDKK